jgi:acetyl esterase/lipase
MSKILYTVAILLIVFGLAYHFAALQIFNALVPKDAESLRKDIEWAYGSDPRQKLDMYVPRQSSGRLPVVLFVHGGSWAEGDKGSYAFVGRALAAKGFLTLVMNYRLHPQHRYPAFVDDVDLALRWAAENATALNGDPDKIFAMGHSAGAYNVAMAVLDERLAANRPKLAGVITLAGPFDFLPLDTRVTKAVFGNVADLAATQPVNHPRKDAPPFLILHGSSDTTVFPRNAIALDAALKKAGGTSTLKIYPGVGHVGIMMAIAKPLRKTPVLEDAADFIRDRSQ